MKAPNPFRALLVLATVLAPPTPGHSQATAVPGFISYQGSVIAANGQPVGTGTPVNRSVIFRVWDHPSNTLAPNLIYSEQQTVTISEGEFSVLVGQGVTVTSTTQFGFDESTKKLADIGAAFTGSTRYLGVTVDDGTATVDNEITPRQQIVSTPFAFRSKLAETLGTSTGTYLNVLDSGNVGVGNPNPASRLTVTGPNASTSSSTPQLLITDSTDTNERLRLGVDSTGNGTGFLQAFKEGIGAQSLLLNPNGGNVGIGRTNPEVTLDVNGVVRVHDGSIGVPANGLHGGAGQRIILWPGNATSTPYGFGIDGSTLWGAVPVNSTHKWYEGSTERMRLAGGGNLGIGTTAPAGRLNVGEATGTAHNPNSGTIVLDHENNGGASSIVFRSRVNRGSDYGYLQYQDAATVGGAGEASVLTLGTSNDGDDHIALMPAANVGIGTVPGNAKLWVRSTSPNSEGTAVFVPAGISPGYASHIHYGATGDWYIRSATGSGKVILQDSGGNVGIGTSSPTQAKLVVSGGIDVNGLYGAYINGANVGNAVTHGLHPISIQTSGTIWAGHSVIATSDERIKKIQGQSNGATDLRTLLGIEITDFRYKDAIAKGDASQKKVIAQQVEKVFPQAVSQHTDAVPDIYQTAPLKDDWVQLATNLKKGERVRLLGGKTEGTYEVLEVKKEKFRTAFSAKDDKVFVYGREVKDFRAVDYEAISMLHVSATQQLKKEKDAEVKAVQDENAALRTKLAAQETRLAAQEKRLVALEAADKARASKVAAIEKLLLSAEKPNPRTASLKKATGAE